MKKTFLLWAALVGFSLVSYAQTTPSEGDDDDNDLEQVDKKGGKPNKPKFTAEERAKRQSQKLKEKLGLDDDQTQKTYDVLLAQAKKMDELRAKAGAEKKAIGQEFKATRQETETKLKGIFTPEQTANYEKAKQEKKENKQGHGGGNGRGNGHKKGRK